MFITSSRNLNCKQNQILRRYLIIENISKRCRSLAVQSFSMIFATYYKQIFCKMVIHRCKDPISVRYCPSDVVRVSTRETSERTSSSVPTGNLSVSTETIVVANVGIFSWFSRFSNFISPTFSNFEFLTLDVTLNLSWFGASPVCGRR